MIAAIIGLISGILAIVIIAVLKGLDQRTTYGLVLTGIGFLYVGFTWSHVGSLVVTCIQALAFLFIANLGIRRNVYYLIAGFFLHGIWDLGYPLFSTTNLIPPHYDVFCLSIDFTMGSYLLCDQLIKARSGKPIPANTVLPGQRETDPNV